MAQNPPNGFQRIIPYVLCADVGKVMDYLLGACGFTELDRVQGGDGEVMHGELGYQDNGVMFGQRCGESQQFQKAMIYIYVDDVDAHHAHASQAGAKIVQELTDQFYGDRSYSIEDPEGNQWHFATHTRDVSPEEIAAGAAACED